MTSGPNLLDVILKADPAECLVPPPDPPESVAVRPASRRLPADPCPAVGDAFFRGFLHPPRAPSAGRDSGGARRRDAARAEDRPQAKAPRPPPDLVHSAPWSRRSRRRRKCKLDDVEMAHDAPVSGNDARTHKGDPDKETKAPRVAPPPKHRRAAARREQSPSRKRRRLPRKRSPPRTRRPRSRKSSPTTRPTPSRSTRRSRNRPPSRRTKPKQQRKQEPPDPGPKATVADQLAALSPAPDLFPGGFRARPRRSAAEPKKRAMNSC